MTYAAEQATLEQHFATQWGSTTPVQYENDDEFEPPASYGSFVRFFVLPGQSETIGGRNGNTGQRRYRHPGIIHIDVLVAKGVDGARPANTLADQAAAIFRGQRVGDVLCRAPAINRAPPEHGYFKLVVTIPYQRDELL